MFNKSDQKASSANKRCKIYDLNGALVIPDANMVAVGGTETQIEPKAMSVLMMLITHEGETVTREHLIDAVWGKAPPASDEALTQIISKLRHALKDSSREPRFIRTISKQGYRLIAKVTKPTVQDPPLSDATHRNTAAAAHPTAPEQNIAPASTLAVSAGVSYRHLAASTALSAAAALIAVALFWLATCDKPLTSLLLLSSAHGSEITGESAGLPCENIS